MTANVQLSYRDQHGRIFVIGGENASEFEANLIGILGADHPGVNKIFEDFQILADPPVQAAVATAAPLRAGGAPAAAPGAPGAPNCEHGPRAYKEAFKSRAGKDMPSSWQCQSRDRNNQCKAQWNDQ